MAQPIDRPLPIVHAREDVARPDFTVRSTIARRLYRYALGYRFLGDIRPTTGNRATWIRHGTMNINMDHDLWANIHSLTQLFWRYANRGLRYDSRDVARLERRLVKLVTNRGYLMLGQAPLTLVQSIIKGTARPAEPYQPITDPILTELARLDGRIEAWEAKAQRAVKALAKLHRQRARLVKRIHRG